MNPWLTVLGWYGAGSAAWFALITGWAVFDHDDRADIAAAARGAAILAPVWPFGVWLVAQTLIRNAGNTRARRP